MDARPEKHIFISYARDDGLNLAERLESDLQQAGHTTWRDKRNLDVYSDFSGEIEIAIRSADVVAVVVTPSVEQRPTNFVRREIIYAQSKNKPIIPLVFPKADVPILINHLTWIPFFDKLTKQEDYAPGLAELLERLAKNERAVTHTSADPFAEYVKQAYDAIVDGLDPRIIRLIDLKAAPRPDAVNFTPERTSIFKQAFSGVKKSEPEKPPQNFDTFQAGFKLYNERALLLGQPGAGKTITLMAYARDAYAARLADPTQPLPLFGLVATWNPKDKPPLADWLAESLNLEPKHLRDEIDGGRALLLLDGLDELRAVEDDARSTPSPPTPLPPGARGEKQDPRREFLDALPANNRILLTCRIEDYDEIGQKANLNGAITLRDLTAEQVQTYLAEQPHLLRLIEADDQLRELTQTPLLLSIFAFAYQDMTDAEREQLTKIESAGELRDKIFLRYIDQRYEHEAAKIGAEMPLTLAELKEALGKIALENAGGWLWLDKQQKWHPVSHNVIELEWIETGYIITNAYMVLPLAEQLSLLAYREGNTYGFIHLLLRNALAYTSALLILDDPSSSIGSGTAARALGVIKDPRAIEPLIMALYDPARAISSNAAAALGEIGRYAIEPLTRALHSPEADVRKLAAYALGRINSIGIELLTNALLDKDVHVRRSVTDALARIGDARTVEPLINALLDTDDYVHNTAKVALKAIKDSHAVDLLINALGNPNWQVRTIARDALQGIKREYTIVPLINSLNDTNADIRRYTAHILGQIGDARAVEPLINLLNDSDVDVRSSVADVLGQMKDGRAVPGLSGALRDIEGNRFGKRVCNAASAALERIATPEALAAVEAWREEQSRDQAAEG